LPQLLAADVSVLPVNMLRRQARSSELSLDLLALLHSDELHLPEQRFPLAEAAEAMQTLREGRAAGRVALLT